MGFETQEEAERFVEAAEFRAEQIRDERMFAKEQAWQELTELPAFKELPELKGLLRQVFDYAWDSAKRAR